MGKSNRTKFNLIHKGCIVEMNDLQKWYLQNRDEDSVSYREWCGKVANWFDRKMALHRRTHNYKEEKMKSCILNIVSNQEEYEVILKAYDRQIDYVLQSEKDEWKEFLYNSEVDRLEEEKKWFIEMYQNSRGVCRKNENSR